MRGHRFIDLIGQKFSRLNVVAFNGIVKKQATWLCRCDCGKDAVVIGKLLRKGATKSCGCLWLESISLPPGEAALNVHILDYKTAAKKRNLDFLLSREEFIELTIEAKCYYCGKQSRGIDRADNNIGYIRHNCLPCCRDYNVAKGTKTTSEFLDMIELIYHNMWRNCSWQQTSSLK